MGYNIVATAYRALEQLSPDHNQGVKYVMTIGTVKDYAVYKGPETWDNYMIAAQGDKISREEAVLRFGDILTPDVTYRR